MSISTPHTANRISMRDDLGRVTVWAVKPRGLRDALRVLLGRYEARIWIDEIRDLYIDKEMMSNAAEGIYLDKHDRPSA